MIEIIFEPISTDVKKTRGRPKLTDEEKLINKIKKQSLKEKKEPLKRGRKPLNDEEKAERKQKQKEKLLNLSEEEKDKRREAVRKFFSKPENKDKHKIVMKKYNTDNAEVLRQKRSMYFKTYWNNLVRKEAERILESRRNDFEEK
jgi:hypothetical protein